MSAIAAFLAAKAGLNGTPARLPVEIPGVGRDDLARWFGDWGLRRGAEIGVWRGHYSEILLTANPEGHVLSVDAWLARPGYKNMGWRQQTEFDGWEAETRERLAPYGARSTILKGDSIEVANTVPDGSLDWIYIDGDHALSAVRADLAVWVPKVRRGGVVSGHDYVYFRPQSRMDVVPAVHEWTTQHRVSPWFVLGRKRNPDGAYRDRFRSWCWVQE